MRECQNGSEEMLEQAIEAARTQGLLADGDMVVLTAGMPIGVPGTTNLIKVDVVGDVLATGHGIGGKSATARVCVAHDEEEAASRFRAGDILVVPANHQRDDVLSAQRLGNHHRGGRRGISRRGGRNDPLISRC